jgi:two-component system response regulator YesN
MFKVLVADDEPIILSGVKHLIDWEQNNCVLIGAASNGAETLEHITRLKPDIVICDIGMPAGSGLEVLRQISEELPEIVFIMLTNHGEFELARESLRFNAVEYLLKNQLEAEDLEKALVRAIKEREKRGKLNRVDMADEYLRLNHRDMLEGAALRFLDGAALAADVVILEEAGVFNGFGAALIPLDYSTLPDYGDMDGEAKMKLSKWEQEIAEKIISAFFKNITLVHRPDSCDFLRLLCWNVAKDEWEEKITLLRDKLITVSAQITQLCTGILAAGFFTGPASPASRLAFLEDYHYWTGECNAQFDSVQGFEFRRLDPEGAEGQLAGLIRSRNAKGCMAFFDKIIERINHVPHRKAEALMLCESFQHIISVTLYGENDRDPISIAGNSILKLKFISLKTEILARLESAKDFMASALPHQSASHHVIIEKARQFIHHNLERRIGLQDVASHAGISAGYLSTIFKKELKISLMDYINQSKVERSCELIRLGTYRIYEIAGMLGFENAYYFTRVFRRHTGLSPTEYQKNTKKTDRWR